MDENTMWLIVKIGVTVGSFVLLFIFKNQLIRMVSNVIVGSETEEYEGKTFAEVRENVEKKMDRVLE